MKDCLCMQEEILVIDEYGKVLLCCGVGRNDEDYEIGNILEMNLDELKGRKNRIYNCMTCKRCKDVGMNKWMQGCIEFEKGFMESLPEEYRLIVK